jgi:AAA15 family ATPase/GTPase
MIYSFGAKNYFSFKEGFEVSLEFNSKVPKNISNLRKASTILGIKGANASGKTRILTALKFISNFISSSFGDDVNDDIAVKSFFDNTSPIEFYIEFSILGARYTYELSVTPEHVLREAIYKKISRKTLILERKKNSIKYRNADLAALDLITLRSNASIIDTALQYSIKEIADDLKNIHSYFAQTRGNISELGLVADSTMYDHAHVSEYYYKTPEILEFTKKIITNSDLGIKDIVIHKSVNESGNPKYFPIFHHDTLGPEGKWLTYWEESDGTAALYRRLLQYWGALATGSLLLLDEFDTNYHPALLPQILDLFINEKTNPKHAQLLFTSHNLDIMDYLGKYRTYLVSKEDGESFCYRLDEIPGDIIRNDRPISGLYREGKLGGVPKL